MRYIRNLFKRVFKKKSKRRDYDKKARHQSSQRNQESKFSKKTAKKISLKIPKSKETIPNSEPSLDADTRSKSHSRERVKPTRAGRSNSLNIIPFKVLWSSGYTNKNDSSVALIKKYLLLETRYELLKDKLRASRDGGDERVVEEIEIAKFFSELLQEMKQVEHEDIALEQQKEAIIASIHKSIVDTELDRRDVPSPLLQTPMDF